MNRLQKLIKRYISEGLNEKQASQLATRVYGKKPVYGMRRGFKMSRKGQL